MFTHKKVVIGLATGTILAITGIIFFLSFPVIFNFLLRKEMALQNGTVGFNMWRDIPLPIYQKLYFFNITNSDRFTAGREKPKLQEVGPYVYKSRWFKKDIVWHPNGTVSFKEIRMFVFLEHESVGSENDKIVTLNAPLLLVANFLKDYPVIVRLSVSLALSAVGERIIIKKSIRQLAFDGYTDVLMIVAPFIKTDIPFKTGTFAWLYGKNDTDDGVYNVYTGEDDLTKLNVIDMWNGKNSLPFWKEKRCNAFNGSNAEISPPLTPNQPTFSFFQSIFCRALTLDYSEDVDHLGVASKRFVATNMTLNNGPQNPLSSCFLTKMRSPVGTQDISTCQYGAPVVISFPHFYFGDPSLLEGIEGLHPNESLHHLYMDLEPYTGFSVDAKVRFQVNLHTEYIQGISQTNKIPKLTFPIFWIEISFSLTDKLADLFKTKIYLPKSLAHAFMFGLMGVGAFLWTAAVGALWWNKKKQPTEEKKIAPPPP